MVLNQSVVAIHQPNFFPWMGYFDKIKQANHFVFLDNVTISKSGSGGSNSWCKHVKINMNGNAQWIQCPLRRKKGSELIKDVVINDDIPWRKKLIRTISQYYSKSPNFSRMFDIIESLINYPSTNLAEFNIHCIKKICELLDISTSFHRQSEMSTTTDSTELIIEIVQNLKGDIYLCGGGSSGYLNELLFAENNLKLSFQNFQPFEYGSEQTFIPGLSILDYLFKEERLLESLAV